MNEITANSFSDTSASTNSFDCYREWLPENPGVQLSGNMFLVLSYKQWTQATGEVETLTNELQGTPSEVITCRGRP